VSYSSSDAADDLIEAVGAGTRTRRKTIWRRLWAVRCVGLWSCGSSRSGGASSIFALLFAAPDNIALALAKGREYPRNDAEWREWLIHFAKTLPDYEGNDRRLRK